MTTILLRRCGQSFLYTPASSQSLANCAVLDSSFFGPLGDVHSLSAKAEDCVTSPVVVLSDDVRPSAVFRRVTGIVVFPVKRHPIRTFTHIYKKILERHPPIADSNSSATIVGIVSMRRIQAALFHRSPRFVGRGFGARGSVPVPSQPNSVLTVACLNVASPDMRNDSFTQFTAVLTPKNPIRVSVSGFRVLHKNKRTECGASIQPLAMRHSGHDRQSSNVGSNQCTSYGQHENNFDALRAQYLLHGGVDNGG